MTDSDNSDTANEHRSTQTDDEQEKWLAVRRERLAGVRRRNFLIVTTVAIVALILLFLLIWKWRSSSNSGEAAVAPVVSVRVAKVGKETIAAPVAAVREGDSARPACSWCTARRRAPPRHANGRCVRRIPRLGNPPHTPPEAMCGPKRCAVRATSAPVSSRSDARG